MPKKNYVIYYRKLKFYLDHGMRVSRVHRLIGFAQNRWMEPYISMHSLMRAAAKNDMEKNFHKLMNNAVCGKTC